MLVPHPSDKGSLSCVEATIHQKGMRCPVSCSPTPLLFSSYYSSVSIAISLTPGPCGHLSLWSPLYGLKLLGKYHQGCLWKVEVIKCEHRPIYSDGQTKNIEEKYKMGCINSLLLCPLICITPCKTTVGWPCYLSYARALLKLEGDTVINHYGGKNTCKPELSWACYAQGIWPS